MVISNVIYFSSSDKESLTDSGGVGQAPKEIPTPTDKRDKYARQVHVSLSDYINYPQNILS